MVQKEWAYSSTPWLDCYIAFLTEITSFCPTNIQNPLASLITHIPTIRARANCLTSSSNSFFTCHNPMGILHQPLGIYAEMKYRHLDGLVLRVALIA